MNGLRNKSTAAESIRRQHLANIVTERTTDARANYPAMTTAPSEGNDFSAGSPRNLDYYLPWTPLDL